MKQVYLPDGSSMPQLGQGTWQMGEDDHKYEREIAGLRHGVELGMNLIDTAEMYADGKAENIAGNAAKAFARESLYICDKVYPQNANKQHIYSSAERSLKLLGTDYIDLYLLHWREDADLAEVVYCMEDLKDRGWIRRWGVSNFDIDDMEELWMIPEGRNCLVNQVLYHTGSRGIEYSLLPWMREHDVALMSYCPLAQAGTLRRGILNNPVLKEIAKKYNATVEQVMLAWNIRDGHTIAIPRSGRAEHTLLNAQADQIQLTEEDYNAIDQAYPPPTRKEYLDIQ